MPAGIVAANLAGKLADSDRVTASRPWSPGVLLTGSFALLWAGRTSLAALIVGIVVLDIGTQGMQITNQAVIYALRPDARSRINSAYMVCYFVGVPSAPSPPARSTARTAGPASVSSAPDSACSPWLCPPTSGCGPRRRGRGRAAGTAGTS